MTIATKANAQYTFEVHYNIVLQLPRVEYYLPQRPNIYEFKEFKLLVLLWNVMA